MAGDRWNSTVRDVYDPRITNPQASTVWVVEDNAEATWDTSDMPQHVTNPKGKLVLGYIEDSSDHPLADGFDISEGHIKFRVPRVEPRNDYIVVLFGDSGNRSPTFTIN
ncbi:hypothetical protein NEOLEDRAFT_1069546 [Neolentinus lepideus HHB14362 ss-1]|uniref:Uncharacterized protein n=1 Tax=Neolentinus lepideus HHB14362 ss-1 TaxID=1314782 RepID=A0A165R983_9AGAM|nr:hypothetical protein NEOLEDRAFT_1069546 [Neolentinus lepideus HHB14362 ss-1]